MDAMLKKKWLCALRYGNYEQTKGRLRNDDGFCCLGVLCDLIDPKLWKKVGTRQEKLDEKNEVMFIDEKLDYSYDSCGTGHLPQKLREEIGLSSDVQEVASERNDTGDSFEEIADWLEEIDLAELYYDDTVQGMRF